MENYDDLLAAVSEVLHYVWDPISIAGVPQARDKYDSYVDLIANLLIEGASEEEITARLMQLAVDYMGIPDYREGSENAATVLVEWHHLLATVPPGV